MIISNSIYIYIVIVFGYAGLWVPPDGLPDRAEVHVRVDLSGGRDRGRGDRTGG